MSVRFEGCQVVDEACRDLGVRLADLLALSSFWVHPDIVARADGPRHPERRRANLGLRVNGRPTEAVGQVIDGVTLDNNTYANTAFKQALGLRRQDFVGFHVCHIWPGTAYDLQCYTHLANLVGIPAELASLTDHHGHIVACLKFRSWELYGWRPRGERFAPVKPAEYPERWREPFLVAGRQSPSPGAEPAAAWASVAIVAACDDVPPEDDPPGEPPANPQGVPVPRPSAPPSVPAAAAPSRSIGVPSGEEEQGLWAAFYLSKFDHERLGVGNQGDTFDLLARRVGMNRNTLKNHRDAFDPYSGSRRKGWHQATLAPKLAAVFRKLKETDEKTLRAILVELFRLPG